MKATLPRVSILVALFVGSTSLTAATFIVPTDRELIGQADAIAIGRVSSLRIENHPVLGIMTVAHVEIEEWLKGQALRRAIDVYEMGGTVGGAIMFVPGTATFHSDERSLFFLKRGPVHEWRVLNMALGKFNFLEDNRGRPLLVRGAGQEEIDGWTPSGKTYLEQHRFESAFMQFIRSVVADSSADEDYFVPPTKPEGTHGPGGRIQTLAANEYLTLTNTPFRGCTAATGGFRWQIFDTGLSDPPGCGGGVCYRTNGAQTNQTDSVGSASRGLAAWINDGGSNVAASVIGTTAVSAPSFDDGVNAIILNYNGPEWTSNPSAIGFGFVAADSCYQRNGENFVRIVDGDVIIKIGVVLAEGDFEGLLAHELGHTLGFRHSNEGTPTSNNALMRSNLIIGLGPNLTGWDIDAVRSTYPSPACSTTSISGTNAVCADSTGNTASVTSSVGATYDWSLTGGILTGGQGTTSMTYTAGGAGTVEITLRLGGACSGTLNKSVTINSIPSATITGRLSACGFSTGNTASVPDGGVGTTYIWTITNGTITAGTGTPTVTFTMGSTGTTSLDVTVSRNGCSASDSHDVTIDASPSSTITAPGSVTPSSTDNTASVPDGGAGTTYAWSISNGTITEGVGTRQITFSVDTAATTLNVTVTLSGCSTSSSKTIAVGAFPRGDADGDAGVGVSDIFYLINNLFAGGPAPIGSGDADADGSVGVSDVFYLINNIFAGGAPPPL